MCSSKRKKWLSCKSRAKTSDDDRETLTMGIEEHGSVALSEVMPSPITRVVLDRPPIVTVIP